LHYFLTPTIKANYPDVFARLRLAYLEPWTEYASMERLLHVFDQALLPMLMQRALFYSQLPFTQQGFIWERSTVVPNQLRALLKRRDALSHSVPYNQ
jgi:hypothetical protein